MAEPHQIRVRVRWPQDAGVEPAFFNQFYIQPGAPVGMGPEGEPEQTYYLMFGHVGPLSILNEEDAAELPDVIEREIAVRASLVASRPRLIEYWTILGQVLGVLPGAPDSESQPSDEVRKASSAESVDPDDAAGR